MPSFDRNPILYDKTSPPEYGAFCIEKYVTYDSLWYRVWK